MTEEEVDGIGEMLESGEDSATVDEPDEVEHVEAEAAETGDGGEDEVSSHEESVPYERFRHSNERVKELEAQLASLSSLDTEQAPSGDYAALDQRLAAIEGERREAAFNSELNSVKGTHKVFQQEGAESLLLDAIIANPNRPLKETAAMVEKQLKALGITPPSVDDGQPSRAGITSGARRAPSKSVDSVESANAAALRLIGG